MIQSVRQFEFSSQTRHLGLVPVLLVKHLQRDGAIGAGGVVRPIYRRVSAMAEGAVDDVTLKPVAGRKHPLRLGLVICVLQYLSSSNRR
jgi:hypothetical protein